MSSWTRLTISNCRDTQRYRASGNSWAVPVIRWIANRLLNNQDIQVALPVHSIRNDNYTLFLFDDFTKCSNGHYLNASDYPYDYELQSLLDIVDTNPDEKFYISPAGCAGILRRKREHNAGMNQRLEAVLEACAV